MSQISKTFLKSALKRRFSQLPVGRQRNISLILFNANTSSQTLKKWIAESKTQGNPSKRSSSNIVSSPLGEVTIPNISLFDLVFENVKLWERKTAVECAATGRKYTYRQLKNNSKALAASFQNRLKLVKGNFIVVILANCPEYPIVLLAASLCGIVPSTVNPSYTVGKNIRVALDSTLSSDIPERKISKLKTTFSFNPLTHIRDGDEIKWQMQDYDAKLIITDYKHYEKCEAIVGVLKVQIPIVVLKTSSDSADLKGGTDLFELFDQSSSGTLQPVNIEPDDPFILPYSSGTSGGPKGVLLTHKNVVSNLVQISHPESLFMSPTTRFHQDKILGILPMCHIYGITIVTLYTLKEGCRLILLPRFSPRLFLQNIFWKRVNITYVVPPVIALLRDDAVNSKYLRSLNFVVNAASHLVIKDAIALLEKARNIKVIQGYGMTECSPALTHTSGQRMQKLSSIGIPIASTKLKISSLETGEALPKGQVGELCAWGPQVMKGYFNRPQETQQAFDSEGWLKTGDLAYYDDDGDFFIVDRLKDIMKIKGFQVAPAELEEVIRTHPSVKEVAVVGIKDKEHGEIPRAFIVLKQGAQATEEDIKNIVKQKLSAYKQLRGGVRFVDELPRNTLGKIVRKPLTERQ